MASIINGLFSGRSGISSHGVAIAVIGDNISNGNTVGYKRSRGEFEDLVAGGQSTGKIVGSGSSLSAVSNIFEQGTLEFTGKELDLALDGKGYFVIERNGQRFFTRAGNFKVDDEGFMVTQKGDDVLGFPADGSGGLEKINVNDVSQGANVNTTSVDIAGNLDASTSVQAPTFNPGATTFADLNGDSRFSTTVNVFDSLGASHEVTIFFFHTNTNEWQAHGYVDGADITTGTAGFPSQIFTQTMTFDPSTGARNDTNGPAITPTAVPWTGGAAASTLQFNFDPFTQFATSSNIQSIIGDGRGVGSITSLSISRDGTIFALLDNGQSSSIGTIGLANFANPEGLVRVGGNLLQESVDSGAPIVGQPASGTFGRIESGQLELSTVDIASEFVKLITLQRGFQANSRIITTINQLLNEIIQLA